MEKLMLKVVFFARLRELVELDELSLELNPEQTYTVQNILQNLAEQYPTFNDYIEQGNRLMIAVNQEITDVEQLIHAGDELALFPPVTGG